MNHLIGMMNMNKKDSLEYLETVYEHLEIANKHLNISIGIFSKNSINFMDGKSNLRYVGSHEDFRKMVKMSLKLQHLKAKIYGLLSWCNLSKFYVKR